MKIMERRDVAVIICVAVAAICYPVTQGILGGAGSGLIGLLLWIGLTVMAGRLIRLDALTEAVGLAFLTGSVVTALALLEQWGVLRVVRAVTEVAKEAIFAQ